MKGRKGDVRRAPQRPIPRTVAPLQRQPSLSIAVALRVQTRDHRQGLNTKHYVRPRPR